MKVFDIVTVGHFAIDYILLSRLDVSRQTLGGSSTYVSIAARKLDAHAGVVSKVGDDFPNKYTKLLRGNKVDLFGVKKVKSVSTTSFVIKYANGHRRLLLKSRAPPILQEDVSPMFKAKIIHVAPIVGEISFEVIEELRKKTDMLSLDPHGLLRKFDSEGRVSWKKLVDKRVLGQIDVYKSSLQEIRKIARSRSLEASMKEIQDFGTKIVIVTLGRKGAAILFEETFLRIPAIQPKELIDPTGAGDVFAGAFLAEYVNNNDPMWCTCVGSAMSSFKVATVGPLFLAEKEAVYGLAERLLDKCMRAETHNGL
jgi:sugar/nucleoside kinase (ribokinase family)